MYNVLNTIEIGGIAGSSGIVSSCYNTGKIESVNEILELSSADLEGTGGVSQEQRNYIGGIVGSSGHIKNSYNTGDIDATVISDNKIDQSVIMIGGLSGGYTVISNSYNSGNVITNYNIEKTVDYVGGIIGYGYGGNNNYYLKTIDIKGKNINSRGTPKDDNYMKSKDFYDDINKDKAWLKITSKYPILINKSLAKIKPLAEITIENTIKKFKITTDVNEINGIKGGSITGEDEEPYETVIYDQSNTKEIIMKPNQNYKIANITINGNRIEYKVNDDGTYTIPAGYFENMKEDKHIVVTYEAENNFISITKTDDFTGELIPNTKFVIKK